MPQLQDSGLSVERVRKGIKMKRSSGRQRSRTDSDVFKPGDPETDTVGILPPAVRARLHDLFMQIEKEFESLYVENLSLQEKLDWAEKECMPSEKVLQAETPDAGPLKAKNQGSQKIKPAQKLRVQTSRIVSSFKPSGATCTLVREFLGHRDGVWHVAVAKSQRLVASASADQRAFVWEVESGKCLAQYRGHSGSVNTVRFHPTQDSLVLTSSGDGTAHVWRVNPDQRGQTTGSSEEELEGMDELSGAVGGPIIDDVGDSTSTQRYYTPLLTLRGHSGVVIAADWLVSPEQIVTASWDRTANVYDSSTGEFLLALTGHDCELTHVCGHPSQRLAVTSSKDTTFRLWDFRDPIHSVSVFQGHTESVTCAVLTAEDKVVSGSDDRSVKVWDLRNMRSPLAAIHLDSPVNILDVSSQGIIAIPHDNRHVRLYDSLGQRIARLPRNSQQAHRRMVCACAWGEDRPGLKANLFTCGFDRRVCGWKVVLTKDKD